MKPIIESVLQYRKELIADIKYHRARHQMSYAEVNVMLNILAGYYDKLGDNAIEVAREDVKFIEESSK